MSASGSVDTGNPQITDEFSVNPTVEDIEKPPKKRVTIVTPTSKDGALAKLKRKSTAVLAATRIALAAKKNNK